MVGIDKRRLVPYIISVVASMINDLTVLYTY